MRETEYRTAHNLGAGQAGGVGLGDEFVLVGVTTSSADESKASSTSSTEASTSQTAQKPALEERCTDSGTAYRLTGLLEEKLKTLVGHKLEVQGRFKNASEATSANETAAAGDKLPPEVVIVSFKDISGSEAVTEPATMKPTATTIPTPAQTEPVRPPTPPPPPPPPPPAQTEPVRPPTTPPATIEPRTTPTDPAASPRRELPRTAGLNGTIALIGAMALCVGIAMMARRRRASL